MSTFSGLNTALTSLIAQRQAVNTAAQNLSNVNTAGYTRQRASFEAIEGALPASLQAAAGRTGGGVRIVSVDRLGDIFLETRVRQETSSAAKSAATSATLTRMETALGEPSNGLSAELSSFFTSWQDVANSPEDATARSVVLERANGLVSSLRSAYTTVQTQWETVRAQADAVATQTNTTAAAVADLNARIQEITVGGGNPNDLIDQRAQLLNQLSGLVGAEARQREDGTVDVMVAGNALVRGSVVNPVALEGTRTFSQVGVTPSEPVAADAGPVRLVWAGDGRALTPTGGALAAHLSDLAPAGEGGALASLAESYNAVATELATAVNSAHQSGHYWDSQTATAIEGAAFFTAPDTSSSDPAVFQLSVALTDGSQIAAMSTNSSGGYDGSNADAIAQIKTPGALWAQKVVDIGVQTSVAKQLASADQTTLASAEEQLSSATGVDSEEEILNVVAYQRAYQASSRLVTAIDEMLDTLINRTGTVGR
jgi:flagellar hook-associated protein FlgK